MVAWWIFIQNLQYAINTICRQVATLNTHFEKLLSELFDLLILCH